MVFGVNICGFIGPVDFGGVNFQQHRNGDMIASHARHLPSLPPWKVEVPESERSKGNMNNVTNGSNESNGTEEVVWHGKLAEFLRSPWAKSFPVSKHKFHMISSSLG